jgi:hypothetical protein
MNRLILCGLLLLLNNFCFSQATTTEQPIKKKNRYVLWMVPTLSNNIYGIAIGLIGSEAICGQPYTRFSHGLNVQIIGEGLFQTFQVKKGSFAQLELIDRNDTLSSKDIPPIRALHNGLLVSPFGTFTEQINGTSISLWMSTGIKVNGLAFNLLWSRYEEINGVEIGFMNHAASTKGMQIGVINKTKKLKGLQIGIWNKNEKRSLPILNWNF